MNFWNAKRLVDQIGRRVVELNQNSITGVAVGGYGERPISEIDLNEFCIVLYVPRMSESIVPRTASGSNPKNAFLQIARSYSIRIDPNEINIVEVGDLFRAQQYSGSAHANPPAMNTQKWFKYIRPGISIINPIGTYPNKLACGTASFFVHGQDGTIFLISCNHVIAGARRAGEKLDEQRQQPVIQPATMDLSGSDLDQLPTSAALATRFQIAELSAFVPIVPDAGSLASNIVDAAAARLIENGRDTQHLSHLPYCGKILGVADPYEGDERGSIVGSSRVYKVGRTTGYTEGQVFELGGTTQIHYDGWSATFVDQIGIRKTADNTGLTFSEPGDSGSPILNDEHKLVGLLFAGGPRRSLANPISSVMNALSNLLGHVTLVL